MLLLGRYGISEDRVLAMSEAEVMGWLDAHRALQGAPARPAARGQVIQTRTSHIQSLRRKPAR